MSQHLRQDDSRISDLESIRDCPASILQSAHDDLGNNPDGEPFADELFKRLQEITNNDKSLASLIMRQIFWFGTLCDRYSCTNKDLITDLGAELADFDWTEEQISTWKSNASLLGDLASTNIFQAARKAIELSYDYVNVYRQAKILTDVRPVYNSDASKILSAIVSYCLRFSYDTTDGLKDIAIMMEDHEVRSLEEQCERALRKGKTAEALLTEKAQVPTKISGKKS